MATGVANRIERVIMPSNYVKTVLILPGVKIEIL